MTEEPNMDQEDILDPDAQEKMSPEEYAKARDDAMKHLKAELPFLRVEAEYHKLQADVEEHKTRKLTMIIQRSQFFKKQEQPVDAAPPMDAPPVDGPAVTPPAGEDNKPPRKLAED